MRGYGTRFVWRSTFATVCFEFKALGGEGSSEVCFEVFLKAGKGRGRPEFAFALNPRLQIDLPGRVGVMLLFRVPSWRPKQPAQLAGLLVAAWLA